MLAAIPLTLLAAAGSAAGSAGSAAPNVLYLISDDLRPEFGAYNQSAMCTPNVDRLAAEGTVRPPAASGAVDTHTAMLSWIRTVGINFFMRRPPRAATALLPPPPPLGCCCQPWQQQHCSRRAVAAVAGWP
jgi:hypothetical protein